MKKKIQNNSTIEAGVLYRAAEIGTINDDNRTIELSFSSEQPVDRFFGLEILDHGKESVVLDWINSGKAPLLADHDPSNQIGVIEKSEIGKDRIGRAVVRFGKGVQADAYFQDVKDGIRGNISVGYQIHQMILEEETETGAVYRITKWEPLEISLVSIPADQTVGIGRSDQEKKWAIEVINSNPKIMEKRSMDNNQNGGANPSATPNVDNDKELADTRNGEIARIREIQALAMRHDMQEKGNEFISSGKAVNDFRAFVLDNLNGSKPIETVANNGSLGLSAKEARNYSFLRIMRAVSDPTNKRAWDDATFEREVSDAVSTKFKRKFQGNIQIPTEVLVSGIRSGVSKRDLNVSNSTQGGYLVANELQPASFIELLRNRLLVRQLGARVLTGLEGNIHIPKQTGGATAYWLGENGAPSESEQTIGQVALTPKTVGAYTEFTRRMILQSSIDVENFVRDDLAKVLATAIDKAALKGSGSGGEPMGILNTTGIGSVTITSGIFTDAKMIDLESEVAIDNADLGTLAYLACAADRGRMKKADIGTDTGKRVWTTLPNQPGVGEVNGYFAYATNQLEANEVIFGNWEDLIIGEWGVLDMLVNPYAKDTSGGIRITAFQDVDCAVRRVESFARTSL